MHHLRRSLSFLLLLVALSNTHMTAGAEPFSPFNAALHTLQKQIGYEFVAFDLLRRAMTHPSFSGENNRALADLGLRAVQASAALRALQADLDISAAALARRVTHVSTVGSCATAGERLGLQKVLRVSSRTNSSEPSVLCGAFRAVFGAIAVDSEKIDAAGEVFWRVNGGVFWRVNGGGGAAFI